MVDQKRVQGCVDMVNIFTDSLRFRLLPAKDDVGTGEDNPPDAAVAVIIDPFRLGNSLLLIRRRERSGDPWSGQIAFPGGHKATYDRTFLETSIREANEEVGILLLQPQSPVILDGELHTLLLRGPR